MGAYISFPPAQQPWGVKNRKSKGKWKHTMCAAFRIKSESIRVPGIRESAGNILVCYNITGISGTYEILLVERQWHVCAS